MSKPNQFKILTFSESKMSDTEFLKRFNASSFLHSGLLPDRKKFTMKAVFLLVCFPILVIVTVGCFGCLCLRRPDFLPRMFRRKNKFTPPVLKAATGGFSRKNLVGKSEGVDIYRGVLRDGTEVRIEIYWDGMSRENRRRFIEECKVVTQLCHKNIVQVLGWCNSRRMRAIVTEWMEGKNVEIWISESAPPRNQRLKILMGVVNGMCYLQEEWPEVGYDLRTSSVLLSDDLEPLISRFKLGDQSSSSRKIYEFGLFLLEILVNKIPSDHEFQSGENGFIDHVRMHYPRNLRKVIDEKIKMTERIFDQAEKVIGLGLMCTDQSGSHHHLQLDQISDIITRAYESWDVLDSPVQNRSYVDRDETPESKRDICPVLRRNGATEEFLLFLSIYLPIKLSIVLLKMLSAPVEFSPIRSAGLPARNLLVAQVGVSSAISDPLKNSSATEISPAFCFLSRFKHPKTFGVVFIVALLETRNVLQQYARRGIEVRFRQPNS
ncbi:probable serine/threonine-protein kinase At1g01540 [Carya illinoinensis]|uniref:probable serine/threonine-protein kinase At1g01540 n=1 Tax=Carya illinoinensis TaxID=32201 RepID=UPI001C7247CB|nr:probable serine/threonine-protein kinase At1g01540 [Carya illinoinensis]